MELVTGDVWPDLFARVEATIARESPPMACVFESLGHSNWAFTARHYARWMDDAIGQQFTSELDSGKCFGEFRLSKMRPNRPNRLRIAPEFSSDPRHQGRTKASRHPHEIWVE